jgi:microcystin-dependent protein
VADPVSTNPDADGLVGQIIMYGGETLPSSKYRGCHGVQTLSRTEFSLLFSRFGELWGAGDGSTTFNLPNLDGRMLVGFSESDGDFDAVGGTGGTKAATMPAHIHTLPAAAVSNPVSAIITTGGAYNVGGGSISATDSVAGTGDNMPPFATVRYIVKVT